MIARLSEELACHTLRFDFTGNGHSSKAIHIKTSVPVKQDDGTYKLASWNAQMNP